MFKKIEVWILYLFIVTSVLFILVFGVLVRQGIEGYTKVGSIDIEFLTKPAVYISRLPEQFLMSIFVNAVQVNDPWKKNRNFFDQKGP